MFDAALPPDAPLMQDPAFAAALRTCGQNPVALPTGLMVLQRRIFGVPVLMLPRATPPPNLRQQLRQINLHQQPLILSPERPCTLPCALRLRGPQIMAQLGLHIDTSVTRTALHTKWRNQLRRAEGAGLRVSHGPLSVSDSHTMLATETAQARTRRYANWPAPLTAAFAKVAPTQTQLFVAYMGNTSVAHMLFLRHGTRATYHIGHISERGKSLCAHNLLLWMAMCWLADQGHTTLDLGMIDPRTPGLNRFKQRTGARMIQTGGTWLHWRPLV